MMHTVRKTWGREHCCIIWNNEWAILLHMMQSCGSTNIYIDSTARVLHIEVFIFSNILGWFWRRRLPRRWLLSITQVTVDCNHWHHVTTSLLVSSLDGLHAVAVTSNRSNTKLCECHDSCTVSSRFEFERVKEEEVVEMLGSLDPNKAARLDSISCRMLNMYV